jgi:hypothetical protein
LDLSLEHWKSMSATERQATAKRVARQLPNGFELESVQTCELAGLANQIAQFRYERTRFVLVPGGLVSIGFDAGRWTPVQDERESWAKTVRDYGIAGSIEEHVTRTTTRRRQVELDPLLIEAVPHEAGWERIDLHDPTVQKILAETSAGGDVEYTRDNVTTRVNWSSGGNVIAQRARNLTHADLIAELAATRTGFRYPTPDEWEYACGGGAWTLFRWGDHVPCDRYPTDVNPAGGFESDWDHHRQLNAFGLQIATDPYKFELTHTPGITRGGDGGTAACGGMGFFMGWLALATAYFEDHTCKHDPAEPIAHGHTLARRVFPLT